MKLLIRVFCVLMSVLPIAACGGSAPRTNDGAEDDAPFDIEKSLAREVEPLPAVRVEHNQKAWSGMIEGRMAPNYQDGEGYYAFDMDIGTNAPISCLVYDDSIDPASSTAGVMRALTKSGAIRQLELAAYVVGVNPVLLLQGLYTVEQDGTTAVGLMKIALLAASKHPVICFHDELGYIESFERISLSFFNNMVSAQPAPTPTYAEIHFISMQGVPVGFVRDSTYCREDKSCLFQSLSSILLTNTEGAMFAVDDIKSQLTDAAGIVTESVQVSNQQGEIRTRIELRRLKGNSYEFEGTSNGAPAKGSFQTKNRDGLDGSILFRRKLAGMVATGKDAVLTQEEFVASNEDSGPGLLAVDYSLQMGEQGPVVTSTVADMTLTGLVDETGNFKEHEYKSEKVTIHMNRARVVGAQP